ncbi:MAG: serine hydroxymethyltransferase, partial [Melioribacteraceae bacterium]
FKSYGEQVIKNSRTIANKLISMDYKICSGGTDNHLMLVNLTNKDISGKKAEIALEKAGMTVNKNMVPYDTKSPFVTSGIRVGTPAVTSRGMKEEQMLIIAELIDRAIKNSENETELASIKNEVKELCNKFPLYPELKLN